jgi:hypothetical protein
MKGQRPIQGKMVDFVYYCIDKPALYQSCWAWRRRFFQVRYSRAAQIRSTGAQRVVTAPQICCLV